MLVVIESAILRVSNCRATHLRSYLSRFSTVHDRPDRLNRTGSADCADHLTTQLVDGSGRLTVRSFDGQESFDRPICRSRLSRG